VKNLSTGATRQVNLTSAGAQPTLPYSGDGAISSDGRYVVFFSGSPGMVPGPSNFSPSGYITDIFRRGPLF
jgi:hypothetical protein